MNDGDDTYENPNLGNTKYHIPLEEDEEHQNNSFEEPTKYFEGTNDGDDDDNHDRQSENTGLHEETSKITGAEEEITGVTDQPPNDDELIKAAME